MVYGVIYKHTNKLNNKCYIGQTTVSNIDRRFRKTDNTYRSYKSCPAFFNALNKYGWVNFETEILVSCFDQDFLNKMEEYFIKYYNSLAPFGYNTNNLIEGSVKLSEITKQKIGQKQKEYYESLEVKPVAKNKKEHIFINGVEHKECSKCKENKILSEFVKNKNRWDGLGTYCTPCHNKYRRQYKYNGLSEEEFKLSYEKRKEAMSKGQKNYFNNNPNRRIHLSKITSIPIMATNIKTGEVLQFASAKEANKFGFNNTNIGQAIKHNKPYKGYIWKKV